MWSLLKKKTPKITQGLRDKEIRVCRALGPYLYSQQDVLQLLSMKLFAAYLTLADVASLPVGNFVCVCVCVCFQNKVAKVNREGMSNREF